MDVLGFETSNSMERVVIGYYWALDETESQSDLQVARRRTKKVKDCWQL